MKPAVSIIICTRNRASSLCGTLASISQCEVPPGMDAEMIVVDNGSSDSTADVVRTVETRRLQCRYLYEPRAGQNNGYNAAIAAARGEILLFTDDDVRVPGDWIAGMCQLLLDDQADAVQGGIRVAEHLRRKWLLEGFPMIGASTERWETACPNFLVGANMAISRRVLAQVPRFDPELGPGALGYGGETLFAKQLLAAGYRIRARFDVAVEHHFDEQRLAPEAVTETCRKAGRAKAYLAYHWDHSDLRGFDWCGCVRKTLAYSWKRVFRASQWGRENPPEYWRLPAVEAAAFLSQYAHERRRGRRYERHGLACRG